MKIQNSALALLGFLTILVSSCQKEIDYAQWNPGNPGTGTPGTGGPGAGGPSDNSYIGDWKFKKMNVDLSGISEMTIGGFTQKSIVSLYFNSANETGTMKIDESTITGSGLGYTASSSTKIATYTDDVLVSTDSLPYEIQQSPSSKTIGYRAISADSLVTDAPLVDFDYPGMPPTTNIPVGVKLSWLGDTLVVTSGINMQQVDNSLGSPMTITTRVIQHVKFTRN